MADLANGGSSAAAAPLLDDPDLSPGRTGGLPGAVPAAAAGRGRGEQGTEMQPLGASAAGVSKGAAGDRGDLDGDRDDRGSSALPGWGADEDVFGAPKSLGDRLCLAVSAALFRCFYYLVNAWREVRKRRFNYCLGVTTVFVVVMIAAVAATMISKAPAVFLQQGEGEEGQVDALLEVSDTSEGAFLNYTAVQANTAAWPSAYSYHSPRQRITAWGYTADCDAAVGRLSGVANPEESLEWRYGGPTSQPECRGLPSCMQFYCPSQLKPVSLRLIDSERERRMGFGRHWKYPVPMPAGSVLVAAATARKRGLSAGDTAWIELELNEQGRPLQPNLVALGAGLLGVNVTEVYGPSSGLPNATQAAVYAAAYYSRLVAPVRVLDVVSDFEGKFGGSDDDLFLMEYAAFYPWLLANLNPELRLHDLVPGVSVAEALAAAQPGMYELVSQVAVNLPPPRTDAYLSSDYDDVQRTVVGFISRALYAVGFPDVDPTLALLDQLFRIRFFTLYLGLVLSVILTILFVLSAMLIYSLLMISIETRTFELGVHRMVGMGRASLVQMLLVQALSYALPAWVLGLVCAQALVTAALGSLEDSVGVPLDRDLTPGSVWLATGLGIGIPLLASVVPIRAALGRNLHDSLDTGRSKTVAVVVTVERSEDQGGTSAAWLVLGTGLAVFGFLIYYLLPLSLLTFNLALFFNIFFGLLLGMLFGLILLSLNVEHLVERLVVLTMLSWWETRAVHALALKNLVAHRVRNRKTTMMYALALGFVIFITVAFRMELKTAEHRVLKEQGQRLRVTGWDPIPPSLAAEMSRLVASHDAAESHTWVSQELGERDEIKDSSLTNLGHIREAPIAFWGAAPNFYKVALSEFTLTPSEDTTTGLPLAEQLYTVRGSQAALVPSSLLTSHDLSFSKSWLAAMETGPSARFPDMPAELRLRRLKGQAYMDSSAVFLMSRFPNQGEQDAAVSFPTFVRLAGGSVASLEDLHMKVLLVKPRASAPDARLSDLATRLRELADRAPDAEIWDFRDVKSSLDQTNAAMTLIFSGASFVAMFLCLFSLMASMYTNIFEQSKEIAVLRAIGMHRGQIVRLYIEEAFVLVTAASILGFMIGAIMAWTMVAQRVLFTQLPVTIQFPYELFFLVVGVAVVCALLASWAPARSLVRRTVAQVMRSGL